MFSCRVRNRVFFVCVGVMSVTMVFLDAFPVSVTSMEHKAKCVKSEAASVRANQTSTDSTATSALRATTTFHCASVCILCAINSLEQLATHYIAIDVQASTGWFCCLNLPQA